MPPPPEAPHWILYDGRVIPRRARRLLREQDEAITDEQLIKQINAVPDRPVQTPREVKLTLNILRWTSIPGGGTQKEKCWNITNARDAHIRAFGFKLSMGFLPTLARQRAWYPDVYNRPELVKCAKCGHTPETQEHIFDCADHEAVKECFKARFSAFESDCGTNTNADPITPWRWLGVLQGRVHPEWEIMVPRLLTSAAASTMKTMEHLLRASLEAWYQAIWLPRCQRTIEQEQSQGLFQGTKLRRMQTAPRNRANAPESPVPKLPRSFLHSKSERMEAYRRFLYQLMHGTL
jgi:hypothetical protein